MSKAFINCPFCNKRLPFVRKREKVGKDGRIARWNEYEKCSHAGDPNHTSILYGDNGELIKGPEKVEAVNSIIKPGSSLGAGRAIGPVGRLFIFNKESMTEILRTFAERYPGESLTCKMSKATQERLEIPAEHRITFNNMNLRFTLDETLTPGYGYIVVERNE